MVASGLGLLGAGIYMSTGSVTWFWDHMVSNLHDTSRSTHYFDVDTLYQSDDLTISFSEITLDREECATQRTCWAVSRCLNISSRVEFFILLVI